MSNSVSIAADTGPQVAPRPPRVPHGIPAAPHRGERDAGGRDIAFGYAGRDPGGGRRWAQVAPGPSGVPWCLSATQDRSQKTCAVIFEALLPFNVAAGLDYDIVVTFNRSCLG